MKHWVAVPLGNRKGFIVDWALVDKEDYEKVKDWRWNKQAGRGYAVRGVGGVNQPQKKIYMHRQLLGLAEGDGKVVDHINGCKTDNRRSNLRAGSQQLNAQNIKPRGAVSCRGVYRRSSGRYAATIKLNGKKINLGTFDSAEDAAAVAAEARRQHYEWATD